MSAYREGQREAPVKRLEPLDILDTSSFERWRSLLSGGEVGGRRRYIPGVDYKELLRGRSILVLGDTNHEFLGVQKGLVEHLGEIKEAGATHLALEIPSDMKKKLQAGEMTSKDVASGTWIPHQFRNLLEQAKHLGLGIEFMDMPHAESDRITDPERRSTARGQYMGKFLADFTQANPDSKIVAVTGFAHIREQDQIPMQLEHARAPIPYALVGLVSEGQAGYFRGEQMAILPVSVCQAVAAVAAPDERYGYVDLDGENSTGGLDGVIHFPRPQPVSATLRPKISSDAAASATTDLAVLKPSELQIRDEQLNQPLYWDLKEDVDPSVHTWQQTNEPKILSFIGELAGKNGLNKGQAVYLAAMLCAYGQSHRHHMGGSIAKMGFVPAQKEPPSDAYFEFVTLDLFGYEYDPKADYATMMRNKEISLSQLQTQYGFADLAVGDVKEMAASKIAPDTSDPMSALKVAVLHLAKQTHPERVAAVSRDFGTSHSLKVFYRDVTAAGSPSGLPFVAELTVQDFKLSPTEEALIGAATAAAKLRNVIGNIAYGEGGVEDQVNSVSRWDMLSRKRSSGGKIMKMNLQASDSILLRSSVEGGIIRAREKLQFLEGDELAALASETGNVEAALAPLVEAVDSFHRKYGLSGKRGEEVERAKLLLERFRFDRRKLLSPAAEEPTGDRLLSLPGE
jgi:hypothetical protein